MVAETKRFESPDLTPLDFCLWGWMMSEIKKKKKNKTKVDIRDKLLARILDAAARIKEREDQLRRKPCDFRTRVAKFKHLL
jgi:hypothetical protein